MRMSFGETRLASPEKAGVSAYNQVHIRPRHIRPVHKRNRANVLSPERPKTKGMLP